MQAKRVGFCQYMCANSIYKQPLHFLCVLAFDLEADTWHSIGKPNWLTYWKVRLPFNITRGGEEEVIR